MIPTYLLGATASAMGVVANLTGSLGTALWAAALSIITLVVALTDPVGKLATAAVPRGGGT